MPVEQPRTAVQTRISRRDLAQSLLAVPSGNPYVDAAMTSVETRARLIRASPSDLRTLLVFGGPNGLVLAPYDSDPGQEVACLVATPDLAMATWLEEIQSPNQTARSASDPDDCITHELSPKAALKQAVLGEPGIRQVTAIEVHGKGVSPWQALTVTTRTTRWGVSKLGQEVTLQHGSLLDLWQLLRQVVQPAAGSAGACKTTQVFARHPNHGDRLVNPHGSFRHRSGPTHIDQARQPRTFLGKEL